jgi:hypothetical protein
MLTEPASDVAGKLPGMFQDPRCSRIDKFRYKLVFDGVRVGVVIASWSQKFFSYALNQGDTEDVQEAKRSGKVDVGFVVLAKFGNHGGFVYVDAFDVDDVDKKVAGIHLIHGRLGPFWPLPASIATNYNAGDQWT